MDSSPPLVEFARARFTDREWVVADMRTLALDRRFDGILAWDSLFHLTPEDQTTMFPVLQRHAGRRAGLMFSSGRQHGSVLGELEKEPLYHGSLDPEEYRQILAQCGFRVVARVLADPFCGDRTIWLARAA